MWVPNFGYHFARMEGAWRRNTYRALLPAIVRRPIEAPRQVPFSVYAYSNEESIPEQVRSIRSFLRYVGRPTGFHVVSDGSHTDAGIRLLERIDPAVQVESAGAGLPPGLPEKFRRYVTTYPMGKQLGLIMSLPRTDEPVLYADSDVLFFPGAAELMERAATPAAPAYYLPDCHEHSADPRVFRAPQEAAEPVNSGLLLLFQKLDWSVAIERFEALEGEPNFFTNQTLVHLALHTNGAQPLDARKYVLQLDDQTIYPDRYAGPALVLRHYVNPVRHKFWTTS
jgi:hypothetical protein